MTSFYYFGLIKIINTGVKFDMAVSDASYLGTSTNVLAAGRKPYFYSYDTNSGNLSKIPG